MAEDGDRDEKGRFKPGWEGGPGRPRFSIVSIIREKLEQIPEGERRTVAELMVEEYINRARTLSDGIAIRDLIDRFDGKAKQTVHVENDKDAEWLEYLKSIDFSDDSEIEPETGADIQGLPDKETPAVDPGGGGAVGENSIEQSTVLHPGEGERREE